MHATGHELAGQARADVDMTDTRHTRRRRVAVHAVVTFLVAIALSTSEAVSAAPCILPGVTDAKAIALSKKMSIIDASLMAPATHVHGRAGRHVVIK
jgi:hypothetical protein